MPAYWQVYRIQDGAVIRVELTKQLHRTRTWVALGALTVIPIIATIANKLNPREGGGPVNGGIQRFARSGGLTVDNLLGR